MRTRTSKLSRREAIATTLGTGFALATRPVAAQTIMTSPIGLREGEVKIPVKDGGTIPAYRAAPRSGKNPPIMLVVSEIFGLHEHIKDVCRRLAQLGYLAVAPDLFARQGNVATMKNIDQIMSRVVARVPDAQVMADLDATAAWAAHPEGNKDADKGAEKSAAKPAGKGTSKAASNNTDKGDGDRLGMVGFGWGGRQVWLYAAHNPKLKAGVAFYGRFIGERTPNTPKQPMDVVPLLKAPVMGLYGGADPSIPMGTITDMQAALRNAGQPSIVRVYPAAGHAFLADYRPSYRKEDANDAWREMKAWFKRQNVAPDS
jgi:carboxymethylenebutenolidase